MKHVVMMRLTADVLAFYIYTNWPEVGVFSSLLITSVPNWSSGSTHCVCGTMSLIVVSLQGLGAHRGSCAGGSRTNIRRLPRLRVLDVSRRTAAQQVHRNTERHGVEIQHCHPGQTHPVSGEEKLSSGEIHPLYNKIYVVHVSSVLVFQAMRSHEGNEAQVCYFIIQLLLLKPNDFRNRVNDFVKENAPEHWLQSDWHNKHMSYHKVTKAQSHLHHRTSIRYRQHLSLNEKRNPGLQIQYLVDSNVCCSLTQKYPEKLYFEGLADQVNPPMQLQPQYLPIYFGNVCLRFLPVFDIVIHRFLELLPVSKSLETLLDHLGGLYKFHGE